jgi:hypothetical protein
MTADLVFGSLGLGMENGNGYEQHDIVEERMRSRKC